MKFEPTTGGFIPIEQASVLTERWRDVFPQQVKSNAFGRNGIEEILALDNVVGLRFYAGLNDSGELEPIVCGVDKDGNDVLDKIMNFSYPCPPRCPAQNPLNS